MKVLASACVILALGLASGMRADRAASTVPGQFEVGRRTFWDFDPSVYHELFLVRPSVSGSTVERILLTSPVNQCQSRGKFKIVTGKLNETPQALLASVNPCAIPEKELSKPGKCKHCQKYSGGDIALRVRCGTQMRVIPTHIFEDYWFHAATPPKRTSSILELVDKLDRAVGPGVMDEPMFDVSESTGTPGPSQIPAASPEIQTLGAGEFDDLFPWEQDKLSYLYRAALYLPSPPTVQLIAVLPYGPDAMALPDYPPIAKFSSIEGQVTFTGKLHANGSLTNIAFANGHKLLQDAVREVIYSWKFPKEAYNKDFHGTVEFRLNCRDRRP